jgi:hypothetical protein
MRGRLTATWISAVAVTLAFAAETKAGPVLLDMAGPHGVHLGDVLVLWVAGGCALIASERMAREHPAPDRIPA